MLFVNPMTRPEVIHAANPEQAQREVALRELEQQFAKMLLEALNGESDDPLFPDTPLKKLQRDLFNEMASEEWARAGQLGIARQVEQQLSILEQQGAWRRMLVERGAV